MKHTIEQAHSLLVDHEEFIEWVWDRVTSMIKPENSWREDLSVGINLSLNKVYVSWSDTRSDYHEFACGWDELLDETNKTYAMAQWERTQNTKKKKAERKRAEAEEQLAKAQKAFDKAIEEWKTYDV